MRDSLLDTNVWIALTFASHPLHVPADTAFLTISASHRILFCRATQQSFLRLLTNTHVMAPFGVPPLSNHDALATLDKHLAHAAVGFIDEPKDLFPRWRTFAEASTPSPNRWMDAYLAAFAMEAGLDFVTADNGFKTYAGLNPTILAAPAAAGPTIPPTLPPGSPAGGSSP